MEKIDEKLKRKLEGAAVALASINCDDGKPRNIAMEINRIEGDKIIMTDNHLHKFIKNIEKCPYVSMVYWDNLDWTGVRIDGEAEYQTKGKWFDYIKNLETNKGYNPKGAIIIKITEVKIIA